MSQVFDRQMFQQPIPTLEEQTQIARFLDYETTRIDALIAEQQRLSRTAEGKASGGDFPCGDQRSRPHRADEKILGVEWLGEVPEHWDILPFTILS